MTVQHHMTRTMEYPTGWAEYTCAACGRVILVRFEPYQRIVLMEGAQRIGHLYRVDDDGAGARLAPYFKALSNDDDDVPS